MSSVPNCGGKCIEMNFSRPLSAPGSGLVANVRDCRGREHAGLLERERRPAPLVGEERGATAQQDGDAVDLELVEQAGPEVLLGDAGAARQGYVLVLRGRAGVLQRRLDSLRDEEERRASLFDDRLARVMREHEHGNAEGRLLAPPA